MNRIKLTTAVVLLLYVVNIESQSAGNYATLKNLGCWRDHRSKIIRSLEGRSDILNAHYKARGDAIQKCARAALSKGYRVFVIQDSGWCGASFDAKRKYFKLGRSTGCGKDGEGGFRANQVYEIVSTVIENSGRTSSSRIVQPGYVFGDINRRRGTGISTVNRREKAMTSSHDFILNDFGCWALPPSGIDSMEGKHIGSLDGHYRYRMMAVQKCAKAVASIGLQIFALHDGGKCLSVTDVQAIVRHNTRRKVCSYTGKGSRSSIQVYEIRYSKTREAPSPLSTSSTTTTTPLPTYTIPYRRVTRTFVAPTITEWYRPTISTRRTILPIPTPRPTSRYIRYTTPPSRTLAWASRTRTIAEKTKEYLHMTDLGCWIYAWNDSIPTLEGSSSVLDGHYSQRSNAVEKCAKVAMRQGYDIFAIQDGGRCVSSRDARRRFAKLGQSEHCRSDGKGGSWVNQVYEAGIVWDVKISGLGCFSSVNTISSLEGTIAILDGPYYLRKDSIRKCAQVAAMRGFPAFALQDGGKCMGSEKAHTVYSTGGVSNSCSRDGKGGFAENEVYEIISNSKIKLRNLGCWKDEAPWAIPGMEQTDADLMDNFKSRKDAISKCARVAKRNGFKVFVIQSGGWCGGSRTANTNYSKYGKSDLCKADGQGGLGANQVYEIVN
ncbi:uncharacterized protein LOC120334906 [Styela clava]